MEIRLDCLPVGKQAVVTSMYIDSALKNRLRAYGFVPGTQIRCRYRSPGGSVTALELRGSVLALRTADLRNIRGCC